MQRNLALYVAVGLLGALLLSNPGCRKKETASRHDEPKLELELLAFDSSHGPRGERPFISGEKVHLAIRVRGGKAPYELQVATSAGDPRLASASTTVEAKTSAEISAGLELALGTEVPTGTYALTIRVSDDAGTQASLSTESFGVIGSDAPVHPPAEPPLHLRVVDVAGRSRRTFFQGERIAIRATLTVPKDIAIAIVAEDERPFMPAQRYPANATQIDLPLQVPRLARVGSYRVDMATEDEEASVRIDVAGTEFGPASKPTISKLTLYGGPSLRIPQTAVLQRGEPLRIEAIVGGLRARGDARLRLRNRVGKEVVRHEFPAILPTDADPSARTMLEARWTPGADLGPGRHMLEIEVEEDGEMSTIYREIVLQ